MTEYIVKHWRGQFPLGQSCWMNGALAVLPFFVWLVFACGYLVAHPPFGFLVAILVLGPPVVALLLVAAWSGVGIWRSAGRRIDFARPVWGWTARLALPTVAVILVLTAAMFLRATSTMLSTSGAGPGSAYDVTLRGNTAVFHGELTTAAAGELELLLKDKSVKRLALAGSGGGDMGQALRLAGIVHDRKLFVVALTQCDAACTLLLAAGRVRALLPDTIVGFGAASEAATHIYRQAGLSARFFDGLRSQGPDARFEPPLRTLITIGFVTDIFVSALRRYVPAAGWCAKHLAACNHTGRQNTNGQNNSRGSGDDN